MIDNLFNFNAPQKPSIKVYRDGLAEYKGNFDKASALKEFPIFLDTNVLLSPYELSIESRSNLLNLFKDLKDRIYITSQVEKEYLKNRTEVQNKFEKTQEEIEKDFSSSVINQIYNFKNQNKSILSDYPEFYNKLEETEKSLRELLVEVKPKISDNIQKVKGINFSDEFLETFLTFKITEELSEPEIKIVKDQFDILKTSEKMFPGREDVKKKPTDPYGDFIIFHELLKFAKENKTHVIFLTNDSSKGDWFSLDGNHKRPILEYVNIFFRLTGQIIFILEAKHIINKVIDSELIKIIKPETSNKRSSHLRKYTVPHWLEDELIHVINENYEFEFPHPVSHIRIKNLELESVDVNQLLDGGFSDLEIKGNGEAEYEEEDSGLIFNSNFDFSGTVGINLVEEIIDQNDLEINVFN